MEERSMRIVEARLEYTCCTEVRNLDLQMGRRVIRTVNNFNNLNSGDTQRYRDESQSQDTSWIEKLERDVEGAL